jgi:hypothetical protein
VSAPRLAIIAVLFVLPSHLLWAQQDCGDGQEHLTRYELRTVSGHRNPIHVDGYLTFRDDPAANIRFYWVQASVKNVSKKRISYWSVRIETKVRSGPGLNLSHSHDYFFTGGALAPNESESLQSCPIRLVLQPKNGEPFAETRHATIPVYAATMRVELVQYSDGSIWGDQDAAAEVHQFRRYTLDKIESLQQVYSGQGEKAFMEALEEPTADQCFEQIKATCRSQTADSSCVRKAIQQMVATAAQQRDLEAQ